MTDYRDATRYMSDEEAKAFLLDALDVLTRVTPESCEIHKLGIRLNRIEERIFVAMTRAKGMRFSRDHIMDVVYFDQPNEPSQKAIEAQIHYLRKKIKDTPYRIHTDIGRGWYLVEEKE